jgi:hypothetical protein
MSIPSATALPSTAAVAGGYPTVDESTVRPAVECGHKAAVWCADLGCDARKGLPITTMSFTRNRKDVARVIRLVRLLRTRGRSA